VLNKSKYILYLRFFKVDTLCLDDIFTHSDDNDKIINLSQGYILLELQCLDFLLNFSENAWNVERWSYINVECAVCIIETLLETHNCNSWHLWGLQGSTSVLLLDNLHEKLQRLTVRLLYFSELSLPLFTCGCPNKKYIAIKRFAIYVSGEKITRWNTSARESIQKWSINYAQYLHSSQPYLLIPTTWTAASGRATVITTIKWISHGSN
jgi:hypothetical protein